MNFSLLDKLHGVDDAILATVMRTEGHTYRKTGDKALFAAGDVFPVYGNLGSTCVDQDILEHGKKAMSDGRPRTITIDLSKEDDVHFGYGTYCGGVIEILLEPVLKKHKRVYQKLRGRLERGEAVFLGHDVKSGDIELSETRPPDRDGFFVERIEAPRKLVLFGATPLARQIVALVEDMHFAIHVIDWREGYLERFEDVPHVDRHRDERPIDERSHLLVLSHSYEHDTKALRRGLRCGSAYIGLLSSTTRRDKMFEELGKEGVAAADLGRIRSPIGLDIGARSDPEIAVSIVAELVRFANP